MWERGLAALVDNVNTSGKIKLESLLDPSTFDPEVFLALQEKQMGMGGISSGMLSFHSKFQCLFIRNCCGFH